MSKPIFIIGIHPRCGTHYLHRLLQLHPDIEPSSNQGEDFLLYYSHYLVEYLGKVVNKWTAKQNPPWGIKSDLQNALEIGIYSYLARDSQASFVVTKTPHTKGLENFISLFSNAYLIIIVRDGRDVAESHIRTFRKRYDDAFRGWAKGAKDIIKFLEKNGNDQNHILLRYEDLVNDPILAIKPVFKTLGIEEQGLKKEDIENLGVIGSSTFTGDKKWTDWKKEVPKDPTFNPTKRFDDWSRWKHVRFAWMCGEYSDKLGYKVEINKTIPYYVYNYIHDIIDLFYRAFRRLRIWRGGI